MNIVVFVQNLRTRIQARGILNVLMVWIRALIVLSVRGVELYCNSTLKALDVWGREREEFSKEMTWALFSSLVLVGPVVIFATESAINLIALPFVFVPLWFLLFFPAYYFWRAVFLFWRTMSLVLKIINRSYMQMASRYDEDKAKALTN